MYRSIATFSAAIFIAVSSFAAGGASATELKIGGYIGETFTPTAGGYTGTLRTGPGRFTVRDAETGQLIRSGRTGRPGGKHSTDKVNTGTVHVLPGKYKVEVWIDGPDGTVYKGEQIVTATSFTSSQTVTMPVDEQTESEQELDKARKAQDKLDALKKVRKKVLDTAGKTEHPVTYRLLLAAAAQYSLRMDELEDEIDEHLNNAQRQAEQEKAEKEKAEKQKAANEQNTRNNTVRSVQRSVASVPRNYGAMTHTPNMSRMPYTPRMPAPRVETPRSVTLSIPATRR